MWCSHCKQEVPAVARSAQGPLLCSQCEQELVKQPASSGESISPADTGVSLDSFDEGRAAMERDLAPPIDGLHREQTKQRLRRIGRQLRTTYRRDFEVGVSPLLRDPAAELLRPRVKATYQQPPRATKSKAASWLISLLIVCGVFCFGLGLGLLVWSTAFQLPQQWQWGMTATIGAEGVLILGLAWMAARLWRNGRHVNRQLDGVDRQLTEIHQLAGSLAGGRMSSSQHYYDHLNLSPSRAATQHTVSW